MASTSPIPPPSPTPPERRRRWRWGWLVLAALAVALLGTLFWAGWYVYNRGFTRKWRDQLTAELRSRGFDFTARHLTLNPFEGLVAEQAHLYLLDEHHTHLLYINRVAVDISISNLIFKKPFLNSLDLRGASLTLPVDMTDPSGPKLKLHRFQAKLSLLPGEVRLTQAQGDFYGLQISASGTLQHPGSFSPGGTPASPEDRARRRVWAHAVTDEIEKVRSDRTPPRLEILFQGDLARPESLRASVGLTGEALRRGSYYLEKLAVRLDYAAGAFHLRQGELTDRHGTLSALGDYSPATGDVRFQVQSGLDAQRRGLDLVALANEFYHPPALSDFQFRETPRLQIDGRARFGPGVSAEQTPATSPFVQCTGRLALDRFSYGKFEFERAETDFSWNADRWYLRDLRLVRPGAPGNNAAVQQISADVLAEPAGCKVRLTSTFDPMAFVSLASPRVQAALERLEFRDPPRLELTASGRSWSDLMNLRAVGKFALGRTRYRGQGLNRLHGEWSFGDHLLNARNVVLERDEGNGTGEVAYDFDKHEIRLENCHTNLDPATAGVWLDPDVYHAILPYKFRRPPTLAIHGNLQFEGGRNSHLVTEVSAPGGMDFVFMRKNLPFDAIAGQVVFNEEKMQFNDVRGEIFGGEARGTLDLALGRAKIYGATLDLKDVDFLKLTKLYFDYDESRGRLSGSYRWTGRGDDPRTLHGAGSLNVDRGNVFAIPFLGPLSTVVNTVLPGLGFDHAHQATANFLTSDGKIYTGNLDVKGMGFSLFGGGWLGYTTDTMNFRVRMNSRGLPGAVLYPVSKLFEYAAQGSLSKPFWRPKILTAPIPGMETKPLTAPPSASAPPSRGR